MANPKKGTSQARNEFIWGWAFILPTMLGLIILNIYPIFKTIYESFFKTGDFGKGNIFIGFDNYVKLFHDAEVWQALLNTFKYAIVEVPFSIAIALVLAVLLNRKMRGRAVYRTIFFLPMVAAPAAIAMVWRWLFNSEFGLLNHIFHTKINWVSDPKIAVYAIAMQGMMVTVNHEIDFEKAQEIALEYDIIAEPEEKVDVIEELLKEDEEDEKDMVSRPPVVCVMGHVDRRTEQDKSC